MVTATREAASSRPAQRRKTSHANDSKSKGSKSDGAVSARLFDADRTDQTLDFDEALARQVSKRQLLWIDVQGAVDDAVSSALAERLELKPSTRRIFEQAPTGAHVALHGSYLHLRVATEAGHDPSESPCWLDLIAAGNVVLTHHREPIRILAHLDERIETDTTIGTIDAAAFVATAVDAAVTSYFEAVDAIEEDVDRLDGRALGTTSHEDVLAELVQLRRRVARLRRVLSDQREVFAAFATPDFGVVAPGEDAAAFQAVAARFEDALRSVEDSRDLLLGSFDVFMTRTAQRTNEVMKVLALATVLLLPGSLIAGLLGMNVVVPLPKDDPMSFWLVVAAILVLAGGVLVLARVRTSTAMTDTSRSAPSEAAQELLAEAIERIFGHDRDALARFVAALGEGLPAGTTVILRGSAVNGLNFKTGEPFDADGPGTSDLDIVVVGDDAARLWVDDALLVGGLNSLPLNDESGWVAPELDPARRQAQAIAGRPVSIQAMPGWFLDLRWWLQDQAYVELGKIEEA